MLKFYITYVKQGIVWGVLGEGLFPHPIITFFFVNTHILKPP
jgi:hypothetical protein